MLKKIILNNSTKKNLRISKDRQFVDLTDADTAALLIDEVQRNLSAIHYLKDQLAKDHVTLDVFGFYQRKEKLKIDRSITELKTSDFNWLGKDKTNRLLKLEETKYDYLFCFQSAENLIFENILSKSNARCRIGGSNVLNDKGLLDLVVSVKNEKDQLNTAKEALRYLKMIKSK